MPEVEQGHYPYQAPIDSYGNGGFRFAGMSHRGSLLCLPSGMFAWPVTAPDGVSTESLGRVFEIADDIDVLLLGLGEDIAPLSPEIRAALRARRIIVEGVATGSAISTYNILLSEKRAVAAALIAVERAGRRR